MLAFHPPYRPPDMFNRRGRSRQVSQTALARQASEERRSVVLPRFYAMSLSTERYHHNSEKTLVSAETVPPISTPIPAMPIATPPPPPPPPIPEIIPIIAAPVPTKALTPPPFLCSPSPSPPSSASMSPDYYDSPPSPPRSLEDQVHVAYALDDIHLAKILLLRLKGIEITDDDDPRIAAVQDEDFDVCFVPHGRLMDEKEEMAIQERQRLERERLEERRRVQKLRACQQMWEEEKRRWREEKLAQVRRREEEEAQRRREQEEVERRRAAEEEWRREVARERAAAAEWEARRRGRRVVNYASLGADARATQSKPPVTESTVDPFVYDIMVPTTCPPTRSIKPALSKPYPASNSIAHPTRPQLPPLPMFDDSRSIPFTDVLASMQGPLFPLPDAHERSASPAAQSKSKSHSRAKRRREAELLHALLEYAGRDEDARRKRKGKQRAQPRRSEACVACTAASLPSPASPLTPSTPSTASSSISRTNSWLSFRSSGSPSSATSSSSVWSNSTDLTTPSTSPLPSGALTNWFKPTTVPSFASRRPKSWISTPPLSIPSASESFLRHSCHSRSRLSPVAPSEYPLSLDLLSSAKDKPAPLYPLSSSDTQRPRRSSSGAGSTQQTTGVLVRQMSRFVDLAKGLQTAYMSAAMFSVSASYDHFEGRDVSFEVMGSVVDMRVYGAAENENGNKKKMTLRPAGYRVSSGDVAAFLTPALPSSSSASADTSDPEASSTSRAVIDDDDSPPPRYIPLTSPYPPTQPPSTPLPNPLPYKLVFKPIPRPTRSPFRVLAQFPLGGVGAMYPRSPSPSPDNYQQEKTGVTWRVRSIGNPVYLRLKAVQHELLKRGAMWEGRGRETAMGGGRERVVGVAFEGVGRSKLSWGFSGSSIREPRKRGAR